MLRSRKPPSQTWLTFLSNYAEGVAAIDFLTVPTANFRILYVLVVLSHGRRQVIHFNVTRQPTAEWTAQQLREAFPFDCAPRYLLHDRDAIYGKLVKGRIESLGMEEIITAPRSPWQNPFVERVIGSIRRECLDHVIVLNEAHLKRLLRDYFGYYHACRRHLSLNKDPPQSRPVELSQLGQYRINPESWWAASSLHADCGLEITCKPSVENSTIIFIGGTRIIRAILDPHVSFYTFICYAIHV